jgi:hypothetical protein
VERVSPFTVCTAEKAPSRPPPSPPQPDDDEKFGLLPLARFMLNSISTTASLAGRETDK